MSLRHGPIHRISLGQSSRLMLQRLVCCPAIAQRRYYSVLHRGGSKCGCVCMFVVCRCCYARLCCVGRSCYVRRVYVLGVLCVMGVLCVFVLCGWLWVVCVELDVCVDVVRVYQVYQVCRVCASSFSSPAFCMQEIVVSLDFW